MPRSKKKGGSSKQRRRKEDISAQEERQQSSPQPTQETVRPNPISVEQLSSPRPNTQETPRGFDRPNMISVEIYGGSLFSLPPSNIVEAIQRREEVPSAAVFFLLFENGRLALNLPPERDWLGHDADATIQRLVDADLIPTLIDLITADDCMAEGGSEELWGKPLCMWWINMLNSFCMDRKYSSIHPRIASGIAPLVRCMQDDSTREYFRSNKKWHASMFAFFGLIHELSKTQEAFDVLLQYEGFSEFMIQSMLWGKYRPDIINEAESHSSSVMPYHGEQHCYYGFFQSLLQQYAKSPDDGKKKLLEIATTSCVSRTYDANCSTPFIQGLVEHIQDIVKTHDKNGVLFFFLRHFTMVDCLDKDVIRSIVKLGSIDTLDRADASLVAEVCLCTVACSPNKWLAWNTGHPDDKRFSSAIEVGMFEMFLGLMERFGDNREDREDKLTKCIEYIMHSANKAMFLKRTAKSIFKRRDRVLDALSSSNIPGDNTKCMQITRMMKSILGSAQAPDERHDMKWSCKHCLRMLPKEDIRRCGKCHETIYCSRECQVADWRNHKKECNPNAARWEKIMNIVSSYDSNVALHVKKIFNQNEHGFMRQAVLIGHDITDCVCSIDLCHAPPVLKVMPISEFLALNPEENIKCAISKGRDLSSEVISIAATTYEQNGDHGIAIHVNNVTTLLQGKYAKMQAHMKKDLEMEKIDVARGIASRENVEAYWDRMDEAIGKYHAAISGGNGDRIEVEWDNSNVTFWDE